jgi:transcriptional regulator with XRE-family HTH domain
MREVAKGIGVPLTTYREWEYGRSVQGKHLVSLAKFYGVSAESLAGQIEADPLTVQQRLKIAIDHLSIAHSELTNPKT